MNKLLARTAQFRFRLLFTILGVVIVCLALGFLIIYSSVIRAIERENELSSLDAFTKVESGIDWVLESALRFSSIAQSDVVFQEYLNKEYSSERKRREMEAALIRSLDTLLARYDIVSSIILFRDDGQVGGTSWPRSYFSFNPDHPIYSSADFAAAVENPVAVIWNTDYLRYYFSQSEPVVNKTEKDIMISGIQAVGKRGQGSVLLVSVQESALRRFYEQIAEEDTSVVLLNEEGKLFSGMDMADFGKIPDYYELIAPDSRYGSFSWRNGEPSRIVYYRMASTGWIVLKTIPSAVYERDLRSVMAMMTWVAVITLLVVMAAVTIFIFHFTKPVETLTKTMILAGEGQLSLRAGTHTGVYEVDELSRAFNQMLDNIGELFQQIQQVEEEKTRLEIEALQNQLRPHFLYNTITGIRWMATFHGADVVADSLVILIRLLRPVYDSNALLWTLEEELAYLRNYAMLMRMRYGREAVLETGVDSRTEKEISVPRFLLQPIVENCFEHALKDRESLLITVTASLSGVVAEVCVSDNGVSPSPERVEEINRLFESEEQGEDGAPASDKDPKRKGIGLLNSVRRLRAVYGAGSGCRLELAPQGGTAVILTWACRQDR